MAKFDDAAFIEKWRDLPTSSNIDSFSAPAAIDVRKPRILDLCCGTGKGSAHLASSWKVGEIVYIDRSRVALEGSREVAIAGPRSALFSTQFIQQSAESLIAEDLGLFDVIVIRYALHLIASPEVLLSRLFRMLNVGGRLVFNLAGSNVFRFRDPRLNAIPDTHGRAHQYFRVVYESVLTLQNEILNAISSDRYDHLMAKGLLTPHGFDGTCRESYIAKQFDLPMIRRLVANAGIPVSRLSYDTTWLRSSFEDKAAYADLFGSPPLPGIWEVFNSMDKNVRTALTQQVMQLARKRLPDSPRFLFPEPVFTITR